MGVTITDIEKQARMEEDYRISLAMHKEEPIDMRHTHAMWRWATMRQMNERHEAPAWKRYRTERAIARMRAMGVGKEKIEELLKSASN